MPLQSRRPDLPSLQLPVPHSQTEGDLRTPLRTPLTFTAIKYQQENMVMTPDTPAFDFAPPSFDSLSSEVVPAPDEWSENEDGLLQSYLMHPPRAIRNAYPPGSLPPASVLDEITNLVIAKETSSSSTCEWRHSWTSTRARLFTIARQESMEATGGLSRPRLTASQSAPLPLSSLLSNPYRLQSSYCHDDVSSTTAAVSARLSALASGVGAGGFSMSRQQHSMDSLYGDEAPTTSISEAMRLSSSLQVASTSGPQSVLTGNEDLSSPVNFTFNFTPAPRKTFIAGVQPIRPASLLQRGRSFTSADLIANESNFEGLASTALEENHIYGFDNNPTPTKSQMVLNEDESTSTSDPRIIGGSLGMGGSVVGTNGMFNHMSTNDEFEGPTRRSSNHANHLYSVEGRKRSQSSPISIIFASSPPSSISSATSQETDHEENSEHNDNDTKAEAKDIAHPLPSTKTFFSRNSSSSSAVENSEAEPITPLNQTFPHALAMFRRSTSMTLTSSSDSNNSGPPATAGSRSNYPASVSGTSTPAITLTTVESPESASTPRRADLLSLPSSLIPVSVVPNHSSTSTSNDFDVAASSTSSRSSSSSDLPTHALSKLSLHAPGPLLFPSPKSAGLSDDKNGPISTAPFVSDTGLTYSYSSSRRVGGGGGLADLSKGSVRRPFAPPLGRSISDSGMGMSGLSLSTMSLSPASILTSSSSSSANVIKGNLATGRESKRLRGLSNRLSRSAGVGLSVLVPKSGGMAACEELKSPFEHKPVAITAFK